MCLLLSGTSSRCLGTTRIASPPRFGNETTELDPLYFKYSLNSREDARALHSIPRASVSTNSKAAFFVREVTGQHSQKKSSKPHSLKDNACLKALWKAPSFLLQRCRTSLQVIAGAASPPDARLMQ